MGNSAKLSNFAETVRQMKANVPFLEQRFDEFNARIFGGELPRVPIGLGNAAGYIGKCLFKIRRRILRKPELYDFRLRFSTRFDLPEPELEDILIHEMIHYWIGLKGFQDTSSHGKVFRQMMSDINARFGRHITISRRLTPEQQEAVRDSRPKVRVVALVGMSDGRTGIKVLPRNLQRLRSYRRGVMLSGEVATVDFYLTADPFFGRFPCSSALRVHFADMSEVRAHLEGATKL